MNEIEYANRYLGEYKIKGAEIIPTLCPFCNGGSHSDRGTFALNTENHTYNCRRGSCNQTGHFTELCRAKGESSGDKPFVYVKKSYKPSTVKIDVPTNPVLTYVNSRKITAETMKAFGIGTSDNGKIVFPFYRSQADFESNKPTFAKFREPKKILPGEEKMRSETGTEPILFGLHLCQSSKKTLYITEGEFDCMIIYQATEGAINVVSVPTGSAGFTWVETCKEELSRYDNIAVFGDSDSPGQAMLADIISKMSDKIILSPDFSTYKGCKDANEIYFKYGMEGIADVLASMKPQPIDGIIRLSDVRRVDNSSIGRVMTGIPQLDYITGGMLDGDMSVWSGKRAEGKSSLLNQLAIEAVEQGINVCIYSGEVTNIRLKTRINLCAAGKENTTKVIHPKTLRTEHLVTDKAWAALDGWYENGIYLYDGDSISKKNTEQSGIIEKFTAAYKRYDCRLFIVDNLMTVTKCTKINEVMQTQARFAIDAREFAKAYNVHVFLVAHPRKGEMKDSDDISGLGDIANIACNVFKVLKNPVVSGGYAGTDDNGKEILVQHNAEIKVFKNRENGEIGTIPLMYDPDLLRFTPVGKPPKKYSWFKGLEKWEIVTNELEM